jgi:predicted phosphodiesterase
LRIAVISDSHGNRKAVNYLFENYKFDYLIHCGDGVADLGNYIYLDNVFAVSGNCDIFSIEDDEKIIQLENKKVRSR